MNKINIKLIAESAIVAALYVALTWLFAPISYGPVQFRISEVLVLLVVLNPKFSVALIIGCFVSNITSSLGWYDMLFGTLATTIAIIPMCFIRKMPIAAIFPVISNAFIVSLELGIAFELWGVAYWYDVFTVGLGEAIVLYLLGVPLMSAIVKNEKLCELMELDKENSLPIDFLNGYSILAVILFVLSIILYVAYPMYFITEGEITTNYSMFELTKNGAYWLIASLVLGLGYALSAILTKGKIKLGLGLLIAVLVITLQVLLGVFYQQSFKSFYYYLYFLFPVLFIILSISAFKNESLEATPTNNEIEEA